MFIHSITLQNYVDKIVPIGFLQGVLHEAMEWDMTVFLPFFSEKGHSIQKATAVCNHRQTEELGADNFDILYTYNSHLHRSLLFIMIIYNHTKEM